MTPTRRLLTTALLAALLIWDTPNSAALGPHRDAPAPGSTSPAIGPTRPVQPSNGVIIDEAGSRRKIEDAAGPRGHVPPGSPINLFTPDEFQFYTLNGNGQLVMKQMTKQEIQSMIAVGGGSGSVSLPVDMGHHQAQLTAEEPKVSDVVQNVQKVLKGELNKPHEIHNSVTSIPGSVNSQWTNMLPYILSGGSVDQQDVSQDASIILPTLEDDQPYIDVVPFHSSHLADSHNSPDENHIPAHSGMNSEETTVVVTPDVALSSTEKPIYLYGNMALDSGILGEQETYALPTKTKPSKPTTIPTYPKFTTARPSLATTLNNNDNNLKTSTSNKPILYIPLSIQSSIKSGVQNQSSYDRPSVSNINTIVESFPKNITETSVVDNQSTTKKTTPKRPNFNSNLNVFEFIKVPTIHVPTTAFDKISSSTQRTTQQQTPMFEKISSISLDPSITITMKNELKPVKLNVGPMGGFKKPGTSYRPTTSYRPVYDRTTESSTASFTTSSSYHPLYEVINKINTTNILSTFRPGYESRRPVYKPTTKPSNIKITSTSTYHPVYNTGVKLSPHKTASSYRPLTDSSKKPIAVIETTYYSSNTVTTRRPSSPSLEVVTKPSEESDKLHLTQNRITTIEKNIPSTEEAVTKSTTKKQELKITQHKNYTSDKASPTFEIVTQSSIHTNALNLTEYYLHPTQKISSHTIISTSTSSSWNKETTVDEKINDQNITLLDNDQIDKNNDSTTSYINSKNDQNTISYPDITYKLPEKTTDSSELYKDVYSTDQDNDNIYFTTVPVNDIAIPVTAYENTGSSVYSDMADTSTTSQQSEKIDGYTVYDDSSTVGLTQPEESTTKINSDYYTTVLKDVTKESETTLKEGIHLTDEIIESIIQKTTPFISLNEDALEHYTVNFNLEETKQPLEEPTMIQETTASKQESITNFYNNNNNNNNNTGYENPTKIDLVIDYTTPIISSEVSNSTDNYNNEILNEKKASQQIIDNHEISTSTQFAQEKLESTTKKLENLNNKYNEFNSKKPTYKPQGIFEEIFTTTYSNPIKITPEMYNLDKQPAADIKFTTQFSIGSYEGQEKYLPTITFSEDSIIEQRDDSETVPESKTTESTIKYSSVAPQILTTVGINYTSNVDSSKKSTSASVYQTEETTTEVIMQSNKQSEQKKILKPNLSNIKIDTTNKNKKVPLGDNESSTIKVIPVYDDDVFVYTIPADNQGQTTYKDITQKPYKENKNPDLLNSNKANTPESLAQEPITLLSTNAITMKYTTQSDSMEGTMLPGLHETFNNYMKEHYDPSLSTADNYDEISQLTTFPTPTNKVFSSNMDKFPKFNSTTLDFKTTIIPKHQKNQQKLQSSEILTTIFPNLINIESTEFYTPSTPLDMAKKSNYSKLGENQDSIVENTTFKTINMTDSLGEKSTILTTKHSDINIKNSVETPIIYLDLVNPDVDKNNITYQLSKDNMSNYSLTRIKIQNPVLEIDRILLDVSTQGNAPTTEYYTLPTNNVPVQSIASGLIAGYPTYSQAKPITEFVSYSTTPTQLDVTTKGANVNYQEKLLTTLSNKSNNNTDNIKTSAFQYPTTNESSNELNTQIGVEALPIFTKPDTSTKSNKDDSINTSFNSTLEKISDLINQLQNSPSDEDSNKYNYSDSIITTILPLQKFDTIMNGTTSTTSSATSTTFKILKYTSTESQSTTKKILQTLPLHYTTGPYPTFTETTTHSTTMKEASTTGKIHSIKLKDKPNPNSTTIFNIVKQQVMGKPYISTTHSTPKQSMENNQSTIDKSAGRINLEEEKSKTQPMKPTEASRFTMKNKFHYNTVRRPTTEKYSNHKNATKPIIKTSTLTMTESTTSKSTVNIKESSTDKWTLNPPKTISEQVSESKKSTSNIKEPALQMKQQIVALDHATGAIGLDQSNKGLDGDVAEFLNTCNEMSFKFWTLANSGLSSTRSVTMSPFGMISTLAMIFLGARGLTSIQMNDILKLDDVVTFNPHLVFQNITDTVTLARGQGIENAAFVRAIFADRLKVRRIMPFYKEQAQQFYEGAVVDINFSTAGDILRRRTNLLIRKQTGGRIKDFVKTHTVPLRSPLTALSANVFQTSCDGPDASSEGRDGEMYFAVSQTVKQRKLMPIPAVVWKSGVSAGYEPSLDATAVALGDSKRPVSLIMIMPGQQGVTAPGDNLERLEHRLFGNPSDNALEKLLKVIIPRRVEIQMPKFSHRSIVNVTTALKKMGFDQLFTKMADLKGINGAGHDLYLADMLQMNLFCTCGDENKLGSRHLTETYPGTPSRHMRASEVINNINNRFTDQTENIEAENIESSENSDCNEDDADNFSGLQNSNENAEVLDKKFDRLNNLRQKLSMKKLRWFLSTWRKRCRNRRQIESEKPRMKMDKPFLYLIRHNLTGLILHIGRFNPKNQS